MDVFSPYRSPSRYGAPGYGIYPTRPGVYMNGLGDVVMEPGRDYGAWGYSSRGGQHSPYGAPGYGIYGLGQMTEPAFIANMGWMGKIGVGLALGAALGLGAGYFYWGR